MLIAAAAFLVALGVGLVLTPIVRDAAHGAGLLDEPEERKVHETPIPRLGGVAIGAALYIGIAAALVAARLTGDPLDLQAGDLPATLVGAALIGGIGLLDDLQGLRARVKLVAQLGVALVAYGLGLSIDRLVGPWGVVELGPWSLPLTVAWIAAVVNAVNLIDGLDGLASGVVLAAIAALLAIAAGLDGSAPLLVALAATGGGVLAFLRYNFPPATIIMGDTGALLLGFLLAAVGISLTQPAAGGIGPWVPIVVLGLPLGDMTWAVVRRLASGEGVFTADRRHVHHRLLGLGLSTRAAAIVLWGVAAALGVAAVLLARGA